MCKACQFACNVVKVHACRILNSLEAEIRPLQFFPPGCTSYLEILLKGEREQQRFDLVKSNSDHFVKNISQRAFFRDDSVNNLRRILHTDFPLHDSERQEPLVILLQSRYLLYVAKLNFPLVNLPSDALWQEKHSAQLTQTVRRNPDLRGDRLIVTKFTIQNIDRFP